MDVWWTFASSICWEERSFDHSDVFSARLLLRDDSGFRKPDPSLSSSCWECWEWRVTLLPLAMLCQSAAEVVSGFSSGGVLPLKNFMLRV